MARHPTILQSDFPYNISSRCINREWFSLPMDVVWEIFCEELTNTSKQHNLIIHSFVLMSSHYHLLGSTPEANVSDCMQYFNYRTSRRLTREGNRINQTFGGRYYKCILPTTNSFRRVYKYNYRNPVTANICNLVEEYPYSTLQFSLNKVPPKIPMSDIIFSPDADFLKWLNTAPDPKKLEALQFGLKRQFFQSKKDPMTKKLLIADDDTM